MENEQIDGERKDGECANVYGEKEQQVKDLGTRRKTRRDIDSPVTPCGKVRKWQTRFRPRLAEEERMSERASLGIHRSLP